MKNPQGKYYRQDYCEGRGGKYSVTVTLPGEKRGQGLGFFGTRDEGKAFIENEVCSLDLPDGALVTLYNGPAGGVTGHWVIEGGVPQKWSKSRGKSGFYQWKEIYD